MAKSGDVFSIKMANPSDVDDLRKAVKEECLNGLAHCDAPQLVVYKYSPDTEDSPKEQDKLWPGIAVPNDTSARTPLRVVAPAIENQQGTILLWYLSFVSIMIVLCICIPRLVCLNFTILITILIKNNKISRQAFWEMVFWTN